MMPCLSRAHGTTVWTLSATTWCDSAASTRPHTSAARQFEPAWPCMTLSWHYYAYARALQAKQRVRCCLQGAALDTGDIEENGETICIRCPVTLHSHFPRPAWLCFSCFSHRELQIARSKRSKLSATVLTGAPPSLLRHHGARVGGWASRQARREFLNSQEILLTLRFVLKSLFPSYWQCSSLRLFSLNLAFRLAGRASQLGRSSVHTKPSSRQTAGFGESENGTKSVCPCALVACGLP